MGRVDINVYRQMTTQPIQLTKQLPRPAAEGNTAFPLTDLRPILQVLMRHRSEKRNIGTSIFHRSPSNATYDMSTPPLYPLTTPMGRMRQTLREMPASSRTSTTSATSLYASLASSARRARFWART